MTTQSTLKLREYASDLSWRDRVDRVPHLTSHLFFILQTEYILKEHDCVLRAIYSLLNLR